MSVFNLSEQQVEHIIRPKNNQSRQNVSLITSFARKKMAAQNQPRTAMSVIIVVTYYSYR